MRNMEGLVAPGVDCVADNSFFCDSWFSGLLTLSLDILALLRFVTETRVQTSIFYCPR